MTEYIIAGGGIAVLVIGFIAGRLTGDAAHWRAKYCVAEFARRDLEAKEARRMKPLHDANARRAAVAAAKVAG